MNAACAALALALSLCLPGLQDAYEQGPADNAPRVIVQVDHLQQVRGHLVKHDDAGLHIRSLNGDVIVVDPDTAFSVVQLFDANDPVSVVVHMRDGRTIPGTLLIDDWDHVKLDVHGVRLTLGREDVLRVTAAPDVAAMYRTSRAALSDDDEHGRMALARWLMNKKAWTLARTELEDIVARFDNVEAAQLLPQARAHAAVAANVEDCRRRRGEILWHVQVAGDV